MASHKHAGSMKSQKYSRRKNLDQTRYRQAEARLNCENGYQNLSAKGRKQGRQAFRDYIKSQRNVSQRSNGYSSVLPSTMTFVSALTVGLTMVEAATSEAEAHASNMYGQGGQIAVHDDFSLSTTGDSHLATSASFNALTPAMSGTGLSRSERRRQRHIPNSSSSSLPALTPLAMSETVLSRSERRRRQHMPNASGNPSPAPSPSSSLSPSSSPLTTSEHRDIQWIYILFVGVSVTLSVIACLCIYQQYGIRKYFDKLRKHSDEERSLLNSEIELREINTSIGTQIQTDKIEKKKESRSIEERYNHWHDFYRATLALYKNQGCIDTVPNELKCCGWTDKNKHTFGNQLISDVNEAARNGVDKALLITFLQMATADLDAAILTKSKKNARKRKLGSASKDPHWDRREGKEEASDSELDDKQKETQTKRNDQTKKSDFETILSKSPDERDAAYEQCKGNKPTDTFTALMAATGKTAYDVAREVAITLCLGTPIGVVFAAKKFTLATAGLTAIPFLSGLVILADYANEKSYEKKTPLAAMLITQVLLGGGKGVFKAEINGMSNSGVTYKLKCKEENVVQIGPNDKQKQKQDKRHSNEKEVVKAELKWIDPVSSSSSESCFDQGKKDKAGKFPVLPRYRLKTRQSTQISDSPKSPSRPEDDQVRQDPTAQAKDDHDDLFNITPSPHNIPVYPKPENVEVTAAIMPSDEDIGFHTVDLSSSDQGSADERRQLNYLNGVVRRTRGRLFVPTNAQGQPALNPAIPAVVDTEVVDTEEDVIEEESVLAQQPESEQHPPTDAARYERSNRRVSSTFFGNSSMPPSEGSELQIQREASSVLTIPAFVMTSDTGTDTEQSGQLSVLPSNPNQDHVLFSSGSHSSSLVGQFSDIIHQQQEPESLPAQQEKEEASASEEEGVVHLVELS